MKRTFAIVLGVLLLALTTGCCRKTAAPPSVSVHNQKDSIREVIVERVVHLHDSIPFYVPVEKLVMVTPSTDTSRLETSMASSTAFIDSLGFLHHDLLNKDQTIYQPVDIDVPVSDTTREEYHKNEKADTIYVDVPAQLSKGQKFLIRAGWLMVAVFLFGLVYIAYRIWRRN
jgi:hypothetical protein